MPTTVIASVGTRASNAVSVSTVTATTVVGFTHAWTVTLAAAVPATTVIGDKLTTGSNNYLITNVSGSALTVVGDAGIAFTSTANPTAVASTTTRAYSAPNTWASAAPDLVSKDWIWCGEIYKEGAGTNNEWVLGSQFVDVPITFNATSNDSCFYIIRAAQGQSFRDNANKLTNALRYNPANGVAIYLDGAYASFTGPSKTEFYNLQLKTRGQFSFFTSTGRDPIFYSCILNSSNGGSINVRGILYNCLAQKVVIQNGGAYNRFVASTFIGNGGGFGNTTGGNITIRNCAVFNYTSFAATADAANSTYNATNLASFGWTGTGNIVSKTFANQFENVGAGTEDFRVKAGSDLFKAGVRDQTYTSDLDIVGTARSTAAPPNGPTIGAWEYPLITYTYARPASDITTQWSTSSGSTHYTLIDETVADDNDYIVATAAGQTDEVKLQSMTPPQVGTDLVINYKVTGVDGGATVTVSLRQGSAGTLIKTDTAKSANGTYALTVTPADWAAVTDWSDLRLRFVSA